MEIKSSSESCEVLVLGMFEGEQTSQEFINKLIERDKFEGKFGHIYLLNGQENLAYNRILVLGLGKKGKFSANKLREAVAKGVKKIISFKAKTAYFDLDVDPSWGKQAAIGAMIGNYAFDKYKTEKADRLEVVSFNRFSEKDITEGIIFAQAMEVTRNIANEPAQFATPTKLAEMAQSIQNVETKIYEKEECEQMGMGAFLAVGQGSVQPPKFIHMKYSCENPKKKIALVGKGICFDSGGLDIKPASGMLTMKDDMAGAACVLGVMSVLHKLNPQVEIHGIIAACENMPGSRAYKPGDVLIAKNGKTIEVDNTDAEGRLTLADALVYACELGVDEVIDIATLTGACCVALGTYATGIMGNDEDMIASLIETAKNSGETFWQLPLFKEYMDGLKSTVADMKNSGGRFAGASSAGTFLQEFVKDVKWTHLDIAGTAFLDKPQKEFIAGSTGVGVRTFLNYLMK